MKPIVKEILTDGKDVLKNTWGLVRRRWLLLFALFALALGVAFALVPYDSALYHQITNDRPEHLVKTSNALRRWGDFRDTVTMTLVIFIIGWIAKKRTWRTAAVGCFLAACVAGLMINVIRFTSGRPRPHTGIVDGFYGPTFEYKMQSFPSGHAGTSSAFGTSLLVALPVAGIPAALSAAGVVCASMYSRTHNVSDVLVGAATGIIMGILMGLVTRRLMRTRMREINDAKG